MPLLQQPTFSPTEYKEFKIDTPCSGGINLKDLEYELEENQSPDVLNMMYRNGSFCKRYGQEYYKSFDAQVYSLAYFNDSLIVHAGDKIYKDDTIKLIMLDEAFDKMDDFRIDSMLHFFTKLGFQMILATPPQKVPVISESVKSVFMTIRQGEKSTIVPYYNERV